MMGKKNQDDMENLEVVDPYVGGEEDDLSDMQYVQDEETVATDTHPPETKEEAETIAALKSDEEESKESAEEEEPKDAKAEEEASEEEEAEPEVLEPEIKVPKDRFDEVNTRMKSAEDEVKSLKKQLETVVEEKTPDPEPDPYDFATKEKEAMDALLEGDQDKYAEIRAEIRTAERNDTLREAKRISAQGDSDLQETMSFEDAGEAIEVQFPQFLETDENFNSDAREEMLDLYVGYAKSGMYTRVQALQRAADKAAKIHGLVAVSEEAEEIADPTKVVDIKTADHKKKAEAANNQPPAMEATHGGKNEEPKLDVHSMSDEEFDSLPETTKRRIRGDVM